MNDNGYVDPAPGSDPEYQTPDAAETDDDLNDGVAETDLPGVRDEGITPEPA